MMKGTLEYAYIGTNYKIRQVMSRYQCQSVLTGKKAPLCWTKMQNDSPTIFVRTITLVQVDIIAVKDKTIKIRLCQVVEMGLSFANSELEFTPLNPIIE